MRPKRVGTFGIRPYRPSDRSFVIGCLEGLQDHLIALDPLGEIRRGKGYGSIALRETLRTIQRNRGRLLIAEDLTGPIGFVSASVRSPDRLRELEFGRGDHGVISDVYVLPAARGRGAGVALLRAAERHLAHEGCVHVGLNVFAPNDRAHALYRSLGYHDLGIWMIRNVRRARRTTRRRATCPE